MAYWVDVFDDYVSWSSGPSLGNPDEVYVHDLATKVTRRVAAAGRGRSISWARGSGDTLIYEVDAAKTDRGVPWDIRAVDLVSGSHRTLASGVGNAPSPTIDGRWVVWTQGNEFDRDGEVITYDLTSSRRRRTGTTASDAVVSGSTVYVDRTAGRRFDVFSMPLDGSRPPRRISSNGAARWLTAGPAGACWTQSDIEVWCQPTAGEPVLLQRKGGPSNLVSGDGVLAWWDGDGQTVAMSVPPIPGEVPTLVAPRGADVRSVPTRLAADGNRVVWGECAGGDPGVCDRVWIHVARLERTL